MKITAKFLNFILLSFIISTQLFATQTIVIRNDEISFEEFIAAFDQARQLGERQNIQIVFTPEDTQSSLRLWEPEQWGGDNTVNGRINFFIGHLEENPTKVEMQHFYGIVKWGISAGFSMLMDPYATITDLRAIISDEVTSVVIWSSHGSIDGRIYDANKVTMPTNIFYEGDPGNKKRQFILSNCYSNVTNEINTWPLNSQRVFWNGLTSTTDLFTYLMSDRWNMHLYELGYKVRSK